MYVVFVDMKPACSSNMATDGFIGPNTCSIQQENMMFSCDVVFNGRPPHLSWRSANDNQTFNSSSCEVKSNRSMCNLTLRADPSYDGSIFRCDVGQIKLDDRRFSCNTERTKVHCELVFIIIRSCENINTFSLIKHVSPQLR